jgi:hypothetical protein
LEEPNPVRILAYKLKKTGIMDYLLSYALIGILLSFIFDMLNEFVLHSEDKIKFDWGTRIINTIIWPYIIGVFIRSFIDNYTK